MRSVYDYDLKAIPIYRFQISDDTPTNVTLSPPRKGPPDCARQSLKRSRLDSKLDIWLADGEDPIFHE